MPIQVTCPGCHSRFNVSDKFAGKEGPCPKCRTTIRIPKKEDQVVIHAPEAFGPTDSKGRAVLKPIARHESRLSGPLLVAAVAGALLVPAIAFIIGRALREGNEAAIPHWLLAAGAVSLAPPLVFVGYSFLRDQELEPYRGMALVVRVAICSAVYAALWGMYAFVCAMLLEPEQSPELPHLVFLIPLLMVPGAIAAVATLDLEAISGSIHYGLYLGASVLLRLIMGLPPL
jgi:hypothetical protein